MEKEDLIKGEIYAYANEGITEYIFIHNDFKTSSTNTVLQWIYIPGRDYHEKSDGFTSSFSKVRQATEFEKEWLNECIKEKRFVSREQIKEYKTKENNYEIY